MKKLIIVSLILSHSVMLSGKVPFEFNIKPDISYWFWATDTVNCSIDLDNKESRFKMEISIYLSDDVIVSPTILLGTFTRLGQYIYLKDIQTDATMTTKVSDSTLVFIKSPAFLKNRKWSMMSGELKGNYMSYIIESDSASAKQKRAELYNTSSEGVVLYADYNRGIFGSLKIKNDRTWIYSIEDLPILEGTWSRDGNILKLIDSDTQTTYYGIIQGRRLVSLSFPGYLKDSDFEAGRVSY